MLYSIKLQISYRTTEVIFKMSKTKLTRSCCSNPEIAQRARRVAAYCPTSNRRCNSQPCWWSWCREALRTCTGRVCGDKAGPLVWLRIAGSEWPWVRGCSWRWCCCGRRWCCCDEPKALQLAPKDEVANPLFKIYHEISQCEHNKKLTLRVAEQQLSVSHANAVVVVQVDFNSVGWITEAENRHFGVDQKEALERTWRRTKH